MKSWSAALPLACITLLDASIVAAQSKAKLPLGLDPDATFIPDDNPMTPEKIALGKKFFWDKRWSANSTVACVSCHPPDHGWSDPRQFSITFASKPTPRHAPTLVNRLIGSCGPASGPPSRSRPSRTATGPTSWL